MIGLDSLTRPALLRIVGAFGWSRWIVEPGRSLERAPELFSGYLKCRRAIRIQRTVLSLDVDFRHEPVSASHDGLQILRLRRIVLQGPADLSDRGIDALLDVDEDILAPQFAGDLLPRHKLAMLF